MFGVTGQTTRARGDKRIADTHDFSRLPRPADSVETTMPAPASAEE